MKFRKPLLTALTAGALLFAGNLLAQDAPAPPPSDTAAMPTQPMPPQAAPPDSGATAPVDSATMNTPSGELTVRSVMPPAPPAGPAPGFEQLSGGGKYITEDQASAYPLLVNDFLYADHNRDGRISKSEYERWVSQK